MDGRYLRITAADGVMVPMPAVFPSSSSLPLLLQSLSPGDGTLNVPVGFVIGIGVFGMGCSAMAVLAAFWAASYSAKTLLPWYSYGRGVLRGPARWLVNTCDSLVRRILPGCSSVSPSSEFHWLSAPPKP